MTLKSVLALSMHKAGSSIADNIFTEICAARGYDIDRIALQVPSQPMPEPDFFHAYVPKMRESGAYYGMARDPASHDLAILPKLKLIVQVRDPRDCIVSAYFSYRQSHKAPSDPTKKAEHAARQAELQSVDITRFCLDWPPIYRDRMQIMGDILLAHDDILLLHYEQMVRTPDIWLDQVLAFLGQSRTPALMAALKPHMAFEVEQEDPGRHKRQVTPGDHRRKLDAATIAQMNQVLDPVLTQFDYAR